MLLRLPLGFISFKSPSSPSTWTNSKMYPCCTTRLVRGRGCLSASSFFGGYGLHLVLRHLESWAVLHGFGTCVISIARDLGVCNVAGCCRVGQLRACAFIVPSMFHLIFALFQINPYSTSTFGLQCTMRQCSLCLHSTLFIVQLWEDQSIFQQRYWAHCTLSSLLSHSMPRMHLRIFGMLDRKLHSSRFHFLPASQSLL